jgi:hypothetical protein
VQTFAFDAFVSYSHAADGRLAPALRQGLQRFAKPWYRRRAMRVFHDAANLSTNVDLWGTIRSQLLRSRAFILLASTEAAASPWVGREVETWLAANHWPGTHLVHPDRPIAILLTDGEIAWDEAAHDFDWSRTTALPRQLSGAFPAEPLWLDLRWARTADHLTLRYPRFRDGVATLVAALRGKDKDELIGEEIRLWRRARRLAFSAVAALTVLMLIAVAAGGVAVPSATWPTTRASGPRSRSSRRRRHCGCRRAGRRRCRRATCAAATHSCRCG